MILSILFIISAICGITYSVFCYLAVHRCVDKNKRLSLNSQNKNTDSALIPPKEILTAQGIKYYNGFFLGTQIALISIILLILFSKASS